MPKAITVRGLHFGEGRPKLIVPIVEADSAGICQKAAEFAAQDIDIIEWRADFYDDIFNIDKTAQLMQAVRKAAGNKVLLFAFRTQKEGGKKAIDLTYYTQLNKAAANNGADIIDVEIFSGDSIVNANIANIHAAKALVIASNHDFYKTPLKEDIKSRMQKMQDMGADIIKIAVMPQNVGDVLELLSATHEISSTATKPIVAISMGPLGSVTRMVGEVFGSAATFGAIGKTSAPGQIPVDKLVRVLDILHDSL